MTKNDWRISMSLISPFLFACTVNVDAFLVGMSYGFRNFRITICQNLFISLIAFAGTLLSILSGSALLRLLPPFPAKWLGGGLLLCFGCFYLCRYLLCCLNRLPPPEEASLRLPLSPRATILLGLSLSCNNIGIGISASLGGISFFSTALITFFTSLFFLSAGNHIGRSAFFQLPGSSAELLSGIMLILLGLCSCIL